MRTFILVLLAIAQCAAVSAQTVQIERAPLGSGEQITEPGKYENAQSVYEGIYHAPQYMPGYPTAAVIWPKIIAVPCTKENDKITCRGYTWIPEYGRAEYLYFVPVLH